MYGAFDREGVAVSIKDTLTITAGKAGPVLLNRSVNTSKLNLPLSYWQDEDTLVFHIQGKNQANEEYLIRDTVWIKKSNQVHF